MKIQDKHVYSWEEELASDVDSDNEDISIYKSSKTIPTLSIPNLLAVKPVKYFDDPPKLESEGNLECATILLYRLMPFILGSKNPKAVVLLLLYHFGLDVRDIVGTDGDTLAAIARYLKIRKQSAHEQYETLTRKLADIGKNN